MAIFPSMTDDITFVQFILYGLRRFLPDHRGDGIKGGAGNVAALAFWIIFIPACYVAAGRAAKPRQLVRQYS